MNRMMAAQSLGMMPGLHNSEISMHEQRIEPLEHNAELGVYLKQTNQDSERQWETLNAKFNPQHRLLVTAGSGFMAHLWDLRDENCKDL